jgi:hypothetical protein
MAGPDPPSIRPRGRVLTRHKRSRKSVSGVDPPYALCAVHGGGEPGTGRVKLKESTNDAHERRGAFVTEVHVMGIVSHNPSYGASRFCV